jgi:protocatechuate 3,4-dioxygenase beta subunit
MGAVQSSPGSHLLPNSDSGRNRPATPHQILGPFFPVARSPNAAGNLFALADRARHASSESIEINGRVTNRHSDPVSRARIVVWQANRFGRYAHPNDPSEAPLEPDFIGHAEIFSGDDGGYRFTTIMPGVYPGPHGRMRPPHIHFEVEGKFERLITQMYFPDQPLNAKDRALMSASDPALLIAKAIDGSRTFAFDIVLTRG